MRRSRSAVISKTFAWPASSCAPFVAIFLVRRILPRAKIVMTLHDYFPICAHEGQMVTVKDVAVRAKIPVE